MAKSKSFFGLRRGSTKSHTYQVFRGEQITKDRVYEVANPQTSLQMEQRVKLPLVAQAASILKPIINHSFEGVEYGDASVRYFRQLNLRKDALTVTQYVPKGMINTGVADFVISTGSLPSAYSAVAIDTGVPVFTIKGTPDLNGTAGQNITADDVAKIGAALFGSTVYDQITLVASYSGNSYKWKDSAGETKSENYQRFVVSRLIFDTNRFDENSAWKFTAAKVISNGYVVLDFTKDLSMGVTLDENLTENNVDMLAIITSTLDGSTWKRSRENLIANDPGAITYEDVINTYLNSTSAADSEKYLNAGSEAVTITGGETATE